MRVTLFARLAVAVGVLAALPASPRVAFADDKPVMDPTQSVVCFVDGDGKSWRIQCDDDKKQCLFAPDSQLDAKGKPNGKPLERASQCVRVEEGVSRAQLEKAGYTLVPAIADAPYGWTRDGRGRVFQTNFDLQRRLYIGGAYTPGTGEASSISQSAIDFSLLQLAVGTERTRHRFRFVEGEVRLAPFDGELVLLHYDMSHKFADPLLRITTFFGKPRRYDASFDLGFWLDAGRLELRDTDIGDQQLWKIATAHATIDLWRSEDMYSFFRVRGGIGVEHGLIDGNGDRTSVTPGAAVEADVTLDQSGFHRITGMFSYENPIHTERHDTLGKVSRRYKGELNYEVIVLAVNDQPLSLVVGGSAERRDDLPGVAEEWDFVGKVGLRFSLWAPPRPVPLSQQ